MAKDIITELIDELTKLKDEEMKRVAKAIEEGKNPPIPMTPLTVMKKVHEVARHHQMTTEELASVLSIQADPRIVENAAVLSDYDELLNNEA